MWNNDVKAATCFLLIVGCIVLVALVLDFILKSAGWG